MKNHYKTKYFEYSDEELNAKNNIKSEENENENENENEYEDEDEEFIIHSKREI